VLEVTFFLRAAGRYEWVLGEKSTLAGCASVLIKVAKRVGHLAFHMPIYGNGRERESILGLFLCYYILLSLINSKSLII
jgi:hypothetical protein